VRKELIKAGASLLTGRLTGLIANFIFIALLARYLSVENLGHYFLLANLVIVLGILARFGMEKAVLKLYADAINSSIPTLNITKAVTLILSLSALITSLLFYLFKASIFNTIFGVPELVQYFFYVILWFVLTALQLILAEVLRARKCFFKASIIKGTLSNILNLIAALILLSVASSSNLDLVLNIVICNLLLSLVVATIWLNNWTRRKSDMSGSVSEVEWRQQVRALLLFSTPLLLNQLTLFITSQSDIWIVTAFYGTESTALYGASVKIALLTGLALAIANGVLPPYISEYRIKGDTRGLERLLKAVSTIVAIPALIFIILLMIFPSWALSLIYGEPYSKSYPILQILLLGQLINVLVGSCGFVLVMFGYSKALMIYSLIGGGLAVSLALTFAYFDMGLNYIAWSFTIGVGLQQILMLYLCKKLTNISTSINIFKTLKYVREF